MSEVLTSRRCIPCGILFRKNFFSSGDYDSDGRLLAYCPLCGIMHPPLDEQLVVPELSNRKRHLIGTCLAAEHNLPYKKIHVITDDLRYNDKKTFIISLIDRVSREFSISITYNYIDKMIKGSGNIPKNNEVTKK
jgi:hypothetical protein